MAAASAFCVRPLRLQKRPKRHIDGPVVPTHHRLYAPQRSPRLRGFGHGQWRFGELRRSQTTKLARGCRGACGLAWNRPRVSPHGQQNVARPSGRCRSCRMAGYRPRLYHHRADPYQIRQRSWRPTVGLFWLWPDAAHIHPEASQRQPSWSRNLPLWASGSLGGPRCLHDGWHRPRRSHDRGVVLERVPTAVLRC